MVERLDLGRLVSVHAIQPAYVQRAAFVVVLSFLFFMLSMFIYYVRQSALYFLLATGFMVVYLLTMISWVLQRKRVVELYEGGLRFSGKTISWKDIREVHEGYELALRSGKVMVLPQTFDRADQLMARIRIGVENAST